MTGIYSACKGKTSDLQIWTILVLRRISNTTAWGRWELEHIRKVKCRMRSVGRRFQPLFQAGNFKHSLTLIRISLCRAKRYVCWIFFMKFFCIKNHTGVLTLMGLYGCHFKSRYWHGLQVKKGIFRPSSWYKTFPRVQEAVHTSLLPLPLERPLKAMSSQSFWRTD